MTTPQVDTTTLRHTDQCIRDVRRYGFCEHDSLPLIRQMAETRRVPYRVRHPVKYEVYTSLGLTTLFTANLYLTIKLGWPGILAFTATGAGWLVVFVLGVPAWMTMDWKNVLPPDTKDRLR